MINSAFRKVFRMADMFLVEDRQTGERCSIDANRRNRGSSHLSTWKRAQTIQHEARISFSTHSFSFVQLECCDFGFSVPWRISQLGMSPRLRLEDSRANRREPSTERRSRRNSAAQASAGPDLIGGRKQALQQRAGGFVGVAGAEVGLKADDGGIGRDAAERSGSGVSGDLRRAGPDEKNVGLADAEQNFGVAGVANRADVVSTLSEDGRGECAEVAGLLEEQDGWASFGVEIAACALLEKQEDGFLFGGECGKDRGEARHVEQLGDKRWRSNEANAAIALSEDGGVADEETEADAVEEGDFAQVNDELAQVAAGVMEDSGFERLRLFAANDAAFALDDVNAAADAGFQFQGHSSSFLHAVGSVGQAGEMDQWPLPGPETASPQMELAFGQVGQRAHASPPTSVGQFLRDIQRLAKRVFQSGGSTESKIDFTRRGRLSLYVLSPHAHRRTGTEMKEHDGYSTAECRADPPRKTQPKRVGDFGLLCVEPEKSANRAQRDPS